jgi:hypothetical protein
MGQIEKHLDSKTHALLKTIKGHRRLRITVFTEDYQVEKFTVDSLREVAIQEINRPPRLQHP